MAVNSTHCEYDNALPLWEKCMAVYAGEEVVKRYGRKFLPALSGQSDAEYNAYKMRALFYGATHRTVEGLCGAIFRKDPILNDLSAAMLERLDDVTSDRQSLLDLCKRVVESLLITGREGILVDAPAAGGDPYIATYSAESIINWRTEKSEQGDRLVLVVLSEQYEESGEDEFEIKHKQQYRVLKLVDGVYKQEIWRETEGKAPDKNGQPWVKVSETTPLMVGKPLQHIPFQFANASGTSPAVCMPPLLALVNVNLSHYRTSADLEHGRHFTGLPTAWVAGFDTDADLRIGSSIAWVSEDPNASAGFLEFTGQGLSSLETAMKEKQEMMAVLGARMLEEQKRQVEAASTHSIRRRGENNVLASLAKSASKAITQAMKWWAEWGNLQEQVTVQLNTDYVDSSLDPQALTALMGAWQAGGISWSTLFYNLKKGELIPSNRSEEQEKDLIEAEEPQGPEMDLSANQ